MGPSAGAVTPTTVSGNTITWNVANFANTDFNTDFGGIFSTDITAALGDAVCFTVSVTPSAGDNNPNNNTLTQCFYVVSAFDPNEKEVYPANTVAPVNGWLTYIVHFQNTGNGAADNIYVLDTLDSHLDLSTFQLLAYSHRVGVAILPGGIVKFNFRYINLPDSATDHEASKGYVQYKIKVKDNQPLGEKVKNRASIYFDYNDPVVTNTTINTVALSTGIAPVAAYDEPLVLIYPNPTATSWELTVDDQYVGSQLEIFDANGQIVFHSTLGAQHSELSPVLSSGIYWLHIYNGQLSTIRKLVRL